MANPFDIYKATETTHFIKALNAEVTLRSLSLAESARIDEVLLKDGFKDDGKPNVTYDSLQKSQLLRVSLSLVKPKMSVKDLGLLPKDVKVAIDEIIEILTPTETQEGND